MITMKAVGMLILIAGFFVSASIRADDSTIVLKWSSIPDRMETHELYISGEQALYIVRRDAVEMTREDAVPKWITKKISSEELKRMAVTLNLIVGEVDKSKRGDESGNQNRRFCHGFVWVLDMIVDEYNVQYRANCDPENVRDGVQKLVSSTIGRPQNGRSSVRLRPLFATEVDKN